MASWFRECRTAEQGKALYRDLVRKYHPDNGYKGDELKEINCQFKTWWDQHKGIHTDSDGRFYTDEKETQETAEEFMDIISKLSAFSGIEIEICGTWVWISGNTFPLKDQLSSFGCRWSRGKRKWYWTAEHILASAHRYKKPSMDAIRLKYGSQIVKTEKRAMLA